MRVSACPYPDYGTLPGIVSTLSPDAISLQQDGANTSVNRNIKTANPVYNVTIRPEHLQLNSSGKSCPIQLSMEGRADIITTEETVLTFILRKARLLTDL